MKLKTIHKTKYKLIKLELLKSKNLRTSNLKTKIYNFTLNIKKKLLIIYKYHLNNKKIFFFGVPKNVYTKHKKILKNSKHLFFLESYWEKGLLTNKTNIFKYLKKKINSATNRHKSLNTKLGAYFLIQKKPDLIVLLNKNDNLITEAAKLKIPLINLDIINLQIFKSILIYSILKKRIKFNVKK